MEQLERERSRQAVVAATEDARRERVQRARAEQQCREGMQLAQAEARRAVEQLSALEDKCRALEATHTTLAAKLDDVTCKSEGDLRRMKHDAANALRVQEEAAASVAAQLKRTHEEELHGAQKQSEGKARLQLESLQTQMSLEREKHGAEMEAARSQLSMEKDTHGVHIQRLQRQVEHSQEEVASANKALNSAMSDREQQQHSALTARDKQHRETTAALERAHSAALNAKVQELADATAGMTEKEAALTAVSTQLQRAEEKVQLMETEHHAEQKRMAQKHALALEQQVWKQGREGDEHVQSLTTQLAAANASRVEAERRTGVETAAVVAANQVKEQIERACTAEMQNAHAELERLKDEHAAERRKHQAHEANLRMQQEKSQEQLDAARRAAEEARATALTQRQAELSAHEQARATLQHEHKMSCQPSEQSCAVCARGRRRVIGSTLLLLEQPNAQAWTLHRRCARSNRRCSQHSSRSTLR